MPRKKRKIQEVRVLEGQEFFFYYEYESLQECKESQYDHKMEGTQTRRIKTESGNYRLYLRSK